MTRRRHHFAGLAVALGLWTAGGPIGQLASAVPARRERTARPSTAAEARPVPDDGRAITDSPGVPFLAELVARSFFAALLGGDEAALLPLCAPSVDFDGELVSGGGALGDRLQRLARRARSQRLRLRRLVLLDSADMRRHFGPPPARIRRSVRPGQVFALARFRDRGAIAVLARTGRFYRVVALTD